MWNPPAASCWARPATCFVALGLLFGMPPSVPGFVPPGTGNMLPLTKSGRSSRADTGRFVSPKCTSTTNRCRGKIVQAWVVPPRPDGGVALGAGGAGEKPDSEKSAYERLQGMLENDGSTDYIFENNREWVAECLSKDRDTFNRLAKSQKPRYMYIGCSDSRVPAQNMMGLNTGELFVVRNVANLCVNTDHSLLAALTYAVNVLEVTDIIVCGHYGCGGVRAAMENVDHGLLEHWLLNVRNVIRLHNDELQKIEDVDEKRRRLVELNVQESCINLFANPIVQKKQATSAMPKIHGWAYDVETGLLQELKIDFKSEIRKYRDVYRLYEFPRRPPSSPQINGSMTPRRKTTASIAVDPKAAMGWAKHVSRETVTTPPKSR